MRGDVTVSPAERTLRRRDHAAQRDPGPRAAARRNTRTGLLLVSPALALLPLVVEGKSIGVISFSFATPQTFTGHAIGLMLTFANQCAQALDRARVIV